MGLFDKESEAAERAEDVVQEQVSDAGTDDGDKPGVGPILDRVLGFDESGKSSSDRGVDGIWNKIVEGRDAQDTAAADESMPLPPEE